MNMLSCFLPLKETDEMYSYSGLSARTVSVLPLPSLIVALLKMGEVRTNSQEAGQAG